MPEDVLALGRQHYGNLAMSAERRYQALLRKIGHRAPLVYEAIELNRLRGLAESYRESVRVLR